MTNQENDLNKSINQSTNTQLRNQLSNLLADIQIFFNHLSDYTKRIPNIQIPLPNISQKTLNEIKELKKYQSSISELIDKIDLNYFCKENKKKEREIINKAYYLDKLIRDHRLLLTFLEPKPIDNSFVEETIALMNKKTNDARGEYTKLKLESRGLFHQIIHQISLMDRIKDKCNMIRNAIELKKKQGSSRHKSIPRITIIDSNSTDENKLKEIEIRIHEEELKYKASIKYQCLRIENINKEIVDYCKVLNEYEKKIRRKEVSKLKAKNVISEYFKKNNYSSSNNQSKPDKRCMNHNSLSSSNIRKPFIIKRLNVVLKNNNMICKSVMINMNRETNSNDNSQSDLVNEINNLSKSNFYCVFINRKRYPTNNG